MTTPWEDTSFVKVYRDNGPWMDISLEARGLFYELLKTVDRSGLLRLGPDPHKTIARAVNGTPARIREYLSELTLDGCLEVRDGILIIRNFVDAQGARASDRARQAESRERARIEAMKMPKTGNVPQMTETINAMSRAGHAKTETVTPASRLEEKRLDQKEETRSSSARAETQDRGQRVDVGRLMAEWRARAKNQFPAGVTDARDRVEAVCRTRAVEGDWTDVAIKAIGVLADYAATCSPGRRPELDGLAMIRHWGKIEPVLFGEGVIEQPEDRGARGPVLVAGLDFTQGGKP